MILIAIDLGGNSAAVLIEAKRGEAPRLRDYAEWGKWNLPSLMDCLRKWLDLYPDAQVGFEQLFAMPGRAKIANNQFKQALALSNQLGRLGIAPMQVYRRGKADREEACGILRLSSPRFAVVLQDNDRQAEDIQDACAIAFRMQGDLQAAKFEKKMEKARAK